MYKYFFRFVITVITILTANLVTNLISDYLVSFKFQARPVTFTLIAMCVITLVFYPLFIWLEKWLEKLSVRLVKKGNSMAGRYFGLIITFLLFMAILTWAYAYNLYHIDLLKILLKGDLLKFI